MKLAYRTILPLNKRFWGVAIFIFFAIGVLGYQMRHLYRYGSERDNAVDVYEVFRQAAGSLRHRHAIVRDAKTPWSVRHNDVSQMGKKSLFLLRRLYKMLSSDPALSKTHFLKDVKNLIAMEEAYQKSLEEHVVGFTIVSETQRSLFVRVEDLRERMNRSHIRSDSSLRKGGAWLDGVRNVLSKKPCKLEHVPEVPIKESDYTGKHRKNYKGFVAELRGVYHDLVALRTHVEANKGRDDLLKSERGVYKKLFELSDGVAGVLTMREGSMPRWRVLFFVVGAFMFFAFFGMLWFVRGQRRQLRNGMMTLERALESGNDASVPEDLLPILGKMRALQDHQITTVHVDDKDVEGWVRSVLRYNNEIRKSVVGLRDGIAWQNINSLEPANDDMRHMMRQLDVQEDVFSAMDDMIMRLEEGKLSRRGVRDIVRTMKKIRRFYGDVLPGTLKYASESFRRVERRMEETVRIMSLLVRAYDNLRECLPKQIKAEALEEGHDFFIAPKKEASLQSKLNDEAPKGGKRKKD